MILEIILLKGKFHETSQLIREMEDSIVHLHVIS